jgi:hypothetical protein
MSPKKSSTKVLQSKPPANTRPAATEKDPKNNWDRLAVISTAIAPLITLVSIGMLVWQTSLLSNQVGIDTAAQRSSTRSADMRFLSSIHVDVSRSRIVIKNKSDLTLSNSALWILEKYHKNENINEILGEVAGVPACSDLIVDRDKLEESINSGNNRTKPYNTPNNAKYEVNVVAQAPSGDWYLVANSGRIERIDYPRSPKRNSDNDWYNADTENPMQALKNTSLYDISGDTYWEGYNKVAEYETPPISGGDTVTGGPFSAEVHLREC